MNKLRIKLMGMLLLILPLYFFSCSDDEKDGPKVLLPNEEGFYVYGENTVATEPSEPAARMAGAKLDPTKEPFALTLDSVYGKYIYIGAGGSIQFASVPDEEVGEGVFLGSNDATTENGVELGSVDDDIIHGTLEEGGDAIEIAEEGLYYVFVDMNNLTYVITKVEGQVIGDALIDLQWSAGTVLPLKSVSLTETVFEATEVKMQIGGFKFRFNEGWHSFTNEDMSTFSFLGELSYGDAWAAQEINPGFFNDNIPCFAKGLYTVTLKFTANPSGGEGVWTGTIVKTGEVPTDYSATEIGFFGNAFFLSAGVEGSWGEQGAVKTPTKAGNVYTWTWNDYQLIQDREFILREDGIWTGVIVDFDANTTRAGDAFTSKITKAAASENFFVTTGGVYDISLSIDGVTNAQTLTITSN